MLAHNTETLVDGVPLMVSDDTAFSEVDPREDWHEATADELAAYDDYLADLRIKREYRHAPRRKEAIESIISINYGDDDGFESAHIHGDLDPGAIRSLMVEAYNAGAGI